MTLSQGERAKNIDICLRLMLRELADRAIDLVFFDPSQEGFKEIPQTTWSDLETVGWVTVHPFSTGVRYRLTGAGWTEGLARTGAISKEDTQQRLGKLSAAFKGFVEGRKCEIVVGFSDVVQKADLPEDWVFNAIEGHLLERCFKRRDVSWWEKGRLILVPPDFGMTPVDVAADLRAKIEELQVRLHETWEQLTQFQCPHCRAPMVQQAPVPLSEDDEGLYEEFECGYATIDGFKQSPCPSDPDFPKLGEYELVTEETSDRWWICLAKPKTKNAKSLQLMPEHAPSPDEARQRIVDQYERRAKR